MSSRSILIIESCEKVISNDFSSSSIVHVRNSKIIQDILGCDLISHVSEIPKVIDNKYDAIICMYGSPYMKYNAYMEIMDKNSTAKMFWLVNDHDLEDNILLRKWLLKYNQKYHMVCNNPREGYRHWILGKNMNGKKLTDWIDEWNTINLNVLVFDMNYSEEIKQDLRSIKKRGCIYYGTFRKHRVKDMLDYNGAEYIISTSKKNVDKYKLAGIEADFMDRLSWQRGQETLFNFKYSIYFEDVHTHSNYAFMANRYYECLMCDVLMFFDKRCDMAVEKSGYWISDYLLVSSGQELNEKMKELNDNPDMYLALLHTQQSNKDKVQNERDAVVEEIQNIFLGETSAIKSSLEFHTNNWAKLA